MIIVGTRCLLRESRKQSKLLACAFGWIKLTYSHCMQRLLSKIHTHFRKIVCSPCKRTEEGREAKRKHKSISGESQISWVRFYHSRCKWEARRLELRASSDGAWPFRLHCISSFHSLLSISTLALLWAPRGWPICLEASGQRKSLVGDEKRRK